ncbi:MAG: hypothetical protein FD137_770 [Spirochaetes bacterium]|nr:MAG: hypothetical protein FD137_770 [Spirochaetota bacterium]
MRNRSTHSRCLIPAFLLPIILASGCSGILGTGKSTLSLVLTMDPFFSSGKEISPGPHAEGVRTIAPSSSWIPVRYTISGQGPGESTFSLESGSLNAQAQLLPGDWHIQVSGFTALGLEVARGSLDCALLPNKRVELDLTLYPLQGSGQVNLHIIFSSPLGEGGRIKGSLAYLGLPGHVGAAQPVLEFDYASSQPDFILENIAAGYHKVSLWAQDAEGTRVGGLVDSILVVNGLSTSGTYTIPIGAPEANFNNALYSIDPLPPPCMTVRHLAPANHPPRPAAFPTYVPQAGETTAQGWHLFGDYEIEARGLAETGVLGEGWYTTPYLTDLETASFATLSFFQSSRLDWRACAGTCGLDLLQGNESGNYEWKASYNYRAAMDLPFHAYGSAGTGTGASYQVRALGVSASGIIAVSGLDQDAALHVFGSTGSASVNTVIGPFPITDHVSWVRLWRDRIKVGGTEKSADRLGVSPDGSWIAAASSFTTWLKLYKLGERGLILGTYEFTSASSGLAELQNIKALGYSTDNSTLYIIANTSKHLIAMDLSGGEPVFKYKLQLSSTPDSIFLDDLKVLADGTIIVTARDSSQIFLVNDDGTAMVVVQTLDRPGVGTALYKPTSIALSRDGTTFFVLNDGARILGFSKGQGSFHGLLFSYPLPSPIDSAKVICGFYDWRMGDSEGLFCAGSGYAGFFTLGLEKTISSFTALPPHQSFSDGIMNAETAASLEGEIIMGGGSAGTVSVFGLK